MVSSMDQALNPATPGDGLERAANTILPFVYVSLWT